MVVVVACGLVATACGGVSEPELPSVAKAVKGEEVDRDSFLSALRTSFRAGSTAVVSFDVRGGAGLRGSGAVRYTAKTMDSDLSIEDWRLKGASIEIRQSGCVKESASATALSAITTRLEGFRGRARNA